MEGKQINVLLISQQKDIDLTGFKYLHYYLLKNNINSTLLFIPETKKENFGSIKNFISKLNPVLIGFSLMSDSYLQTRELTRYIKDNFKTKIIWGGIHPTIAPEQCLEYADFVCIGEGEKTMLETAYAISNGKDPKQINNLCYLDGGRMIRNPLYPLIADIDSLPQGDHVPISGFVQESDGKIISLDKRMFAKYSRFKGKIYDVMSSRGCPFSCTYCVNHFIKKLYENNNNIRRRSIETVIQEVEKAVRDNPDLEYINFMDDCFLSCDNDYLRKFCEEYKKRIRLPFWVKATPAYINEEKVKILKDAGLAWIEIGLQSGSDRVLKEIYNRKSLKADFLNSQKLFVKYNISSICDVILDNPFETEGDKLEMIQTFMDAPKPFYPQFFSLTFYHGTKIREMVEKEHPEAIRDEDSLKKDYMLYHKNAINDMIRLSAFMPGKRMKKIVDLYKTDKNGLKFKISLTAAKMSLLLTEPIVYFRIIKMSLNGSYVRTFKIMPTYFKKGLHRYLNQFKN